MPSRYDGYPDDDGMWQVRIGDPGPRNLFDFAVYERGAMAAGTAPPDRQRRLPAAAAHLVDEHGGGTGRVGGFQRLAERVSGEPLDGFFDAWLRTGRKPARTEANGLR